VPRRFAAPLLALLTLAACDPSDPGSGGPGDAVTFEAAFPPIPQGLGFVMDANRAPLLAANGDALLTPEFFSLDRGRTWETLPGFMSDPVFFDGGASGVARGTYAPVRFDLAAGTVTPIPNPDGITALYVDDLRARDGALFGTSFPDGAYRHRDGTWTKLAIPDVNGEAQKPVSIAADEASTVYVLLQKGAWVDWLAVSEDDGATWALRSVLRQDGGSVKVLPSGTLLVLGRDRGMIRSTDQGRTWEIIQPPVGTGSIVNVQVTADGQVLYWGYLARDGAPPWTRALDLGALGLETSSDDRIVGNETGGFLIANRVPGVFVAPASGSPLAYAGGFKLASQTTAEISRSQSMVPLPDGSAVAANARYDPASQQWFWTNDGGGRITRLRDGRLASHAQCRIRTSSDGGRTWGAIATRPAASDQLTCLDSYGVLSLSDGRLVASEVWTYRNESFENRLYTSTDQGQSFTFTGRVLAYAADGTMLYGYRERYPDGGRGTPEPWEERFALASMPGGGVLFVTNTGTRVVKRWDDGRETTFGPLAGLRNIYDGDWVAGVDQDDYVYVECGTPLRQFCRSTRPLR